MERKSPLFMLIIISFFAIGCGNSARIRLNQIIEITSTIFPKATSFGEAYSKEKFLSINQILSIKEYSFLETKISSGNKKNESSSVVFPLHKSNDYFITTKSTRELLQGKWQSMDDSSNFLIFNSNQRKEISNGMNTWEIESYVLSDKCKNDTDIETISESENPNNWSVFKF